MAKETAEEAYERGYATGKRQYAVSLLRQCLAELGYDSKEVVIPTPDEVRI